LESLAIQILVPATLMIERDLGTNAQILEFSITLQLACPSVGQQLSE